MMREADSIKPLKIFEDYTKKLITKKEAENTFISLIENSEIPNIRVESINYLFKLEIKTKEVFKTLERSLISDSNPFVRVIAAKSLALMFIDKAMKPLRWALKNETSPLVQKTISDLFEGIEDVYFKT